MWGLMTVQGFVVITLGSLRPIFIEIRSRNRERMIGQRNAPRCACALREISNIIGNGCKGVEIEFATASLQLARNGASLNKPPPLHSPHTAQTHPVAPYYALALSRRRRFDVHKMFSAGAVCIIQFKLPNKQSSSCGNLIISIN